MQTIDSPPNIVLFTNGALNKVDNIVGLAIAWGRFNPLSVDRDRIFGEDHPAALSALLQTRLCLAMLRT